jgi:hypothetical protein
LLVTGIFVGKDLIETAQLRATAGQYASYQAATTTFKTKYDAFPGDLTSVQAAQFNMQPLSRPAMANVTHGNGALENGEAYASSQLASEIMLYWRDLSSAKLIKESFVDATDGPVPLIVAQDIYKKYLPVAKMPPAASGLVFWATASNRQGKNVFYLGAVQNSDATGFTNFDAGLMAPQAYWFDDKFDDGKPQTGDIIMTEDDWVMHLQPGTHQIGDCMADPFFVGPNKYNLTASSDYPTCSLNLTFEP